MTKIDCAQNSELAKELLKFLQEENIIAKQENELILVDKILPKSTLEGFLKNTGRAKHKISLIENNSYLISIPVGMEEIGLDTCEFCGYTTHHELVNVHRRTHQGF